MPRTTGVRLRLSAKPFGRQFTEAPLMTYQTILPNKLQCRILSALPFGQPLPPTAHNIIGRTRRPHHHHHHRRQRQLQKTQKTHAGAREFAQPRREHSAWAHAPTTSEARRRRFFYSAAPTAPLRMIILAVASARSRVGGGVGEAMAGTLLSFVS